MDEVDDELLAQPPPLGHQVHPQLHAGARTGQLDLRLPDVRRAAVGLQRRARRCSRPAGSSSRSRPRCWSSSSSAPAAIRCAAGPILLLAATSLAVVAVGESGCPIPRSAAGSASSRCRLRFLAALGAMVVCYLVIAEGVKRWFYRRYPPHGVTRFDHPATARWLSGLAMRDGGGSPAERTSERRAPDRAGCAGARSGIRLPDCAVAS